MLTIDNLSLSFGQRVLFEKVSLKFTAGNCYGIIGANGSGKSSFLKIISGDIEASHGNFSIEKNKRIAVLRQDQFEFDDSPVLETVVKGNQKLFNIIQEKDALYAKEIFNDEDGIRAAELEGDFAEMNGWEADSDAAKLLSDLGIMDDQHALLMKELPGSTKVKVLLAQTLFGNPDILIMDEPTNNLNAETILWLENFLAHFKNTVLLVSHDRHFLNNVCTHTVDIDYRTMKTYTGNYEFWKEASKLAMQQQKDQNKRAEAKREELKAFVQRFSANASKAKQATSRKNLLEKMVIEEVLPSTRRYPHLHFQPHRNLGEKILNIKNLSQTMNGNTLFKDISFDILKGDKVAFIGDPLSITALMDIISGEVKAKSGTFEWGTTTAHTYFPKEHSQYFSENMNLIEWLRQYAPKDEDETFVRGFLGKMLFSGDEALKQVSVLSGGEKVRCMFSRMMLFEANVLILDEPTAHLDLESITALNDGLMKSECILLFTSHDFQFSQTIANRIIEITPKGIIDKVLTFEEYLFDPKIKELRKSL
jgi:ATPase subunit of ABC transporter with duplicated ATPase domains